MLWLLTSGIWADLPVPTERVTAEEQVEDDYNITHGDKSVADVDANLVVAAQASLEISEKKRRNLVSAYTYRQPRIEHK